MENCKSTKTMSTQSQQFVKNNSTVKVESLVCRSLMGTLLYLITIIPDLMYLINLLLRFMSSQSENHFAIANKVLFCLSYIVNLYCLFMARQYVKHTIDYKIQYLSQEECTLVGYTNNDLVRSKEDMKKTSGYLFSLSLGSFSQCSKKQVGIA